MLLHSLTTPGTAPAETISPCSTSLSAPMKNNAIKHLQASNPQHQHQKHCDSPQRDLTLRSPHPTGTGSCCSGLTLNDTHRGSYKETQSIISANKDCKMKHDGGVERTHVCLVLCQCQCLIVCAWDPAAKALEGYCYLRTIAASLQLSKPMIGTSPPAATTSLAASGLRTTRPSARMAPFLLAMACTPCTFDVRPCWCFSASFTHSTQV